MRPVVEKSGTAAADTSVQTGAGRASIVERLRADQPVWRHDAAGRVVKDMCTPAPLDLEAANAIERLTDLVQTLIDNDPNADAADAVSVLDVWRKAATELLAKI